MTLLFNTLATLFFLSMLAFGVGVCVMIVRNHGQQMLAALMGQPFVFNIESDAGAEIYRIQPQSDRFVDRQAGWRDEGALPLAA